MAERLTLIRRGKRVGAEGEAADYEWWQEFPEGADADALRSVGYEVRDFIPASSLTALADELRERADELWSDEMNAINRARSQGITEAHDRLRKLLDSTEGGGSSNG